MSQQPAYDKYLGIDTCTGMPRSKEVPLCAGMPRYSAANLSIDCGYGWSPRCVLIFAQARAHSSLVKQKSNATFGGGKS